jgi:hypothetical protein
MPLCALRHITAAEQRAAVAHTAMSLLLPPSLNCCCCCRRSRVADMSLAAMPILRCVRATASEVMWPCTGSAASSSLQAAAYIAGG